MTSGIPIRARQAAEYAAQGYYVVQNISEAYVQVTEGGLHLRVGETMALAEFGEHCEKAKAKGRIKVLATPSTEAPKKEKKKQVEQPVMEQPVVQDALIVDAPIVEEMPAPAAQEPTVGNESSEI